MGQTISMLEFLALGLCDRFDHGNKTEVRLRKACGAWFKWSKKAA
jgi:hypothetical protein